MVNNGCVQICHLKGATEVYILNLMRRHRKKWLTDIDHIVFKGGIYELEGIHRIHRIEFPRVIMTKRYEVELSKKIEISENITKGDLINLLEKKRVLVIECLAEFTKDPIIFREEYWKDGKIVSCFPFDSSDYQLNLSRKPFGQPYEKKISNSEYSEGKY